MYVSHRLFTRILACDLRLLGQDKGHRPPVFAAAALLLANHERGAKGTN